MVPALVVEVRAERERLNLTCSDVATFSGCSEPIARALLKRGRLPVRARCLEGFRRFLERARRATSRADMGLL